MKDFNEVILTLKVKRELAEVYKKAIEAENTPKWEENPILNSKGELISNELKPRWSGNHAHVEVGEEGLLTITLISHTLPNLLKTAKWYEDMGAKIIYKNSI
ncbi:hypothetical protein [Enterococcus devriesei]|uniref:hypothetical protein n=1 Tax=Enterococcus devriesei TaxID=319970 RepID=UPI0028E514B3|nr:hypothetical protein [Enterococcus devriesei]